VELQGVRFPEKAVRVEIHAKGALQSVGVSFRCQLRSASTTLLVINEAIHFPDPSAGFAVSCLIVDLATKVVQTCARTSLEVTEGV